MHKTNNVPNKQALELVNPQRLQPIKTMIQHIVSEVRMPGGTVLNNIPFTVKYDREAEHLVLATELHESKSDTIQPFVLHDQMEVGRALRNRKFPIEWLETIPLGFGGQSLRDQTKVARNSEDAPDYKLGGFNSHNVLADTSLPPVYKTSGGKLFRDYSLDIATSVLHGAIDCGIATDEGIVRQSAKYGLEAANRHLSFLKDDNLRNMFYRTHALESFIQFVFEHDRESMAKAVGEYTKYIMDDMHADPSLVPVSLIDMEGKFRNPELIAKDHVIMGRAIKETADKMLEANPKGVRIRNTIDLVFIKDLLREFYEDHTGFSAGNSEALTRTVNNLQAGARTVSAVAKALKGDILAKDGNRLPLLPDAPSILNTKESHVDDFVAWSTKRFPQYDRLFIDAIREYLAPVVNVNYNDMTFGGNNDAQVAAKQIDDYFGDLNKASGYNPNEQVVVDTGYGYANPQQETVVVDDYGSNYNGQPNYYPSATDPIIEYANAPAYNAPPVYDNYGYNDIPAYNAAPVRQPMVDRYAVPAYDYNRQPAYDNYGYDVQQPMYADNRYNAPPAYDYNRQAAPAPNMYYGNVVPTSNDDYYWDTMFTKADGTMMVTDKRNNIVPVPAHLLNNRQPANRQPQYNQRYDRQTVPAYTGYNDRGYENDFSITGAFGDYGQANQGQGRRSIDLGNIRF